MHSVHIAVWKVLLSRMLFYKTSNYEEALGSGYPILEGENLWAFFFLTNGVLKLVRPPGDGPRALQLTTRKPTK